MIERFWVHDAVIVKGEVREGRYGPEPTYEDTPRIPKKAWIVQRFPADLAAASQDVSANRDFDVSYWESMWPDGTDLDPQDRVECHGHLFEVIGQPRRGFTPKDGVHHIEALLKVVEG